ncbi:phosphoglucosamine mutase [Candidatus Sulfidibacterium hydrothermale]|uniref:phosphoglucosamine mutase n=1 Tax=Candidatus Sulfidibacterium hydrothermale TaxID=2875962 RepID=UPI001F0AFB7E|nr:phosphoglucosamine mutase [Candidatus Sulfidibacterium hydrothermale]UBM61826.1 phosphoglucosamine mutase [Candidatus Sulfidibacterium hydrothermale]
MTLIKSISGIRGTIGGKPGDNLTPLDIVKFTAAYLRFQQQKHQKTALQIVVGRDARISGEMVEGLVVQTAAAMGVNVILAGFSTTPTVEMAVVQTQSQGGIILTASHNPKQWNALKLLNENGEFLNAAEGQKVLEIAEQNDYEFAPVEKLGKINRDNTLIDKHIDAVLQLKSVNRDIISKAGFRIVVDAVNSTGGIAIPRLLKALGVKEVIELNCEPTGDFAHNPEPLPENLTEIAKKVVEEKADLGIVVDPDVDRLAFIMENGQMFGEEYTLVAVADYILQQTPGNTVSNLSSTRALRDITEKAGGKYYAAAVGEVNVVAKMKETHAVIGGEGNGGVIYPALHYGRDALVGTALFLTHLAQKKIKISELRKLYPDYFISKNKITLKPEMNVKQLFEKLRKIYTGFPIIDIDGLKIEFPDGWVHLRTSNTEPILRIYAESVSREKADAYAQKVMKAITEE